MLVTGTVSKAMQQTEGVALRRGRKEQGRPGKVAARATCDDDIGGRAAKDDNRDEAGVDGEAAPVQPMPIERDSEAKEALARSEPTTVTLEKERAVEVLEMAKKLWGHRPGVPRAQRKLVEARKKNKDTELKSKKVQKALCLWQIFRQAKVEEYGDLSVSITIEGLTREQMD